MRIIKYKKLIRDNIPEIIEAAGKTCVVSVLSDEEYLKFLELKLDEELLEYHHDKNIEELVDLIEVIYAVANARGYSTDELETIRIKKNQKNGGFEKRLLLEEVREAE